MPRLNKLKAAEAWVKDCWLWLYRGAWHEFTTHEIEMAGLYPRRKYCASGMPSLSTGRKKICRCFRAMTSASFERVPRIAIGKLPAVMINPAWLG